MTNDRIDELIIERKSLSRYLTINKIASYYKL